MNRRDLIVTLDSIGCILLRHGGKRDLYHNPKTGATQPIPPHREINEVLARKIIRDLRNDACGVT